jgi:predicted phage terminase large subunit-like protein
MLLTASDLQAVERELCRRSLAHFARRAWHVLEPAADLKWGWALDAICLHLEAVTDGEITRLLMNVPPGSMKSLLTGVIWPAWEWGPRGMPWKRFIGTAHEETLAIRDSRKCRDLIRSEWYQALWPVELARDLDGKREFGNTAKGVRQARSFTSMTGVRGDCLLGSSKVMTEHGIKTIKNLAESAYSGSVLSYDHDSNKLVYRSVQAVARRSSPDFYRVHFADGRVVECTGDHRIYTARGYVEARLLSEGDSCLRVLRDSNRADRGGHEEAHEERISACGVLEEVRTDDDKPRSWEAWAGLQYMQSQDEQGDAPVLFGVQGFRTESQRTAPPIRYGDIFLSGMRDSEEGALTVAKSEVLLSSVQGRPSRGEYARVAESGLAGRGELEQVRQGGSARLSNGATNCDGGGWCVRGLHVGGATALSPHRPRLNEQRAYKSRDALSIVPYVAPCVGQVKTQNVAVSMVERVRQEQDVFDIQVEGTHCFFANGVLVHNCIILDDPISADSANSSAKLEAARVAFTETLPTRINSDRSAIVVVMQRLNEKDVSGVILEMGLPYVHLCIPMRFDPASRCTTSIGWTDPRTEEGELMFPDRFGEDQVRELEATLGSYGSAGQLQQRPAPRGGGILKDAWFRYYSIKPKLEFRTIHADTAQKTGEKNDYSVFQCWGRAITGEAVMLDQIRGKWEAPELLVQARAFWLKHLSSDASTLRSMMVEDKVSGTGLIQTLRREGVPVAPVQRNNDKVSRAHDSAPFIESGNVLLPIDAPWLSDFLAEVSAFPGGAHDDQLDPLFDAIKLVQTAPAMAKTHNTGALPTANRW